MRADAADAILNWVHQEVLHSLIREGYDEDDALADTARRREFWARMSPDMLSYRALAELDTDAMGPPC